MNANALLNDVAKICKESPTHGATPILVRTSQGDFKLVEFSTVGHSDKTGMYGILKLGEKVG